MDLPAPTIRERAIDAACYAQALAEGYTPLQSTIIGGRLPASVVTELRGHMKPSLRALDPPDALADIDVAAEAVARAVMDSDKDFALCTDHDVDGSASNAVLYSALVDHFGVDPRRVTRFTSHRMREGYGVSDALTDRMLAEMKPGSLVLTADQGSCDEPRIKRLRDEGQLLTVVTDHHEIPEEGIPASALACINPTRPDCVFPDPYIAGCHVAWLLACATRQRLISYGHLPPTAPSLACLLDFVAAGTAADAVSLAKSRNNRAIIEYGLKLINRSPRVAWQALRAFKALDGPYTSADLGWLIGPMINARGRMGDSMAGIQFLLSRDIAEATRLCAVLDADNQTRKATQATMLDAAIGIAAMQAEVGLPALTVYLTDGHPGVHGIVASRLVETFGRPTCCFSPKEGHPGVITGSLRSIAGVHIRNAMASVARQFPDIMLGWGGHHGAGGCAIHLDDLGRFQDAFGLAITEQVTDIETLGPTILTDGPLQSPPTLETLAEINALDPFGREFEAPVFTNLFQVVGLRPVGDRSHLKLKLRESGGVVQDAIWFRAVEPGQPPPIALMQWVQVAYQIDTNTYRGATTLDLKVKHAQPTKGNG